MIKYDVIIGGAGLSGAVLANMAKMSGKSVLVVEKDKVGGMCADDAGYSECGPHIFHTSDVHLWEWVQRFTRMIPIHYSPLVQYGDEFYSFPINLLTLHQMGVDPSKLRFVSRGKNFEEACVYMLGSALYEKFFYHYTKKMWGVEPRDLPAGILKRIPVRLDYNTSYYNDTYVGVPEMGYSRMIKSMIGDVEVVKGDFVKDLDEYRAMGGVLIYTGHLDELYEYQHGKLPYRGLGFVTSGKAKNSMTINFTDDRPITRRVSYKYLHAKDIQIEETPTDASRYYPVPWGRDLYEKYNQMASKDNIYVSGRAGLYQYLDMNIAIERAISLWQFIMMSGF